jgi:hypothetical protein
MKGILHKVNGSWMIKDPTGESRFPLFSLNPYEQHDGLQDGAEVEYEVEVFYETGLEEPYLVATLSTPFVSDDFQIGPDGAFECNEEELEKLRTKNYKRELDEFHYHEVLDRLTLVGDIIERHLIDHPVMEQHKAVRDLIEKANEYIAEAYLEMGGIISSR